MKGIRLRTAGLYGLYSIVGMIVLLTITALTPRQWGSKTQSKGCQFAVYVSGDMMHTDFVVPVRTAVFDWSQHLDLAHIGKHPSTVYRYLQFGWGDRIFYRETAAWNQLNLSSAVRSLVLQNPAAVFVKGHATVPRYPNSALKCLSLDQASYLQLMQFLVASFETDRQGKTQWLSRGQDGDSSFYAATGRYSILKTCNSWTAAGLRTAAINTPLWNGLAPAVMHQLNNTCSCSD